MEQFNKNILDIIGNTPIIKLQKIGKELDSEIYVKLEYLNPGGSIKDRIGRHMCQRAFDTGLLKKGGTIVEATSGNTGAGIALFATINECNAVFVMADKQSPEKISSLKAMGAQVVLCPTNVEPEDPRSYYSVAKALADNLPNCFYANQYHNGDNADSHFYSTGPEIWKQTQGKFDTFIAGVGTGGTISGTSKFLKTKMPNLKVVGVDIEGSILTHFHRTGEMSEAKPYVLEGLGEDFIPSNINFDIIDQFVQMKDEESFVMTRRLLQEEGIYAGGSSGCAIAGAIKYAETLTKPEKILVIIPDSGSKYASKIYNDNWMKSHNYKVLERNPELETSIKNLIPAEGVKII